MKERTPYLCLITHCSAVAYIAFTTESFLAGTGEPLDKLVLLVCDLGHRRLAKESELNPIANPYWPIPRYWSTPGR